MVKLGLLERFYMSKKFKQDFLMLKYLAYVPESDVSFVNEKLKKQMDKSFKPFFMYIETTNVTRK